MLYSLRRKFICIAMASVTAVLAVILGVSLLISYREIGKRADNLLAMLSENQGEFPDALFLEGKRRPSDRDFPDPGPVSEDETGGMQTGAADTAQPDGTQAGGTDVPQPDGTQTGSMGTAQPERPDGMPPGRPEKEEGVVLLGEFSAETPYETRFFSVLLDENGESLQVSTGNIAAVSDETAVQYAAEITESGRSSGYYDVYRYQVVEETEGTRVIFVDCSTNLSLFRRTLLISFLVALAGLILVFIPVVYFSRVVFRPVEEGDRKQKQFITDASHELKTPLTIIDANTEVMEMIGEENEWTRSTRHQVKRLTGMVQQLVTLTRLDEGSRIEKKRFCLSDAAAEESEAFVFLAETKGKTLETEIQEGLWAWADEAAVRQLISILLDNAVKYSDAQGRILLKTSAKGRKGILTVRNTVDEIEVGNQDVLFERFYRRDASRNSSTGGSGIGLSIAKAVVTAHGGKIHAHSRTGKELEIQAEIPLS